MSKRPTGPFWDASHNTKAKQEQLDKLKLNPPRDQDNADLRPTPPKLTPGGEPNRAARGAKGYKKPETVSGRIAASNEIDITKGVLDMLNSPEWIDKMQKQAQDKN